MSAVAALIADMARSGVDPDIIGRTAALLADRTAVLVPDAQAERRRAADRERKALRNSAESAETPPSLKDPQPNLVTVQVNPNPPPYSPPALKNSRGNRISANWQPSERNAADALALGMPAAMIEPTGRRFRDFWTAKAGKDAVKLDWDATWRNWCSSECDRKGWAPSSPSLTGADPPSGVRISPITDPEAWEAWREARGGKALPTDREGYWTVQTRLPDLPTPLNERERSAA